MKFRCLGQSYSRCPDISAVLTDLVFIITESTVECGQLSELILFVIVLTFGSGSSLMKRYGGQIMEEKGTNHFEDNTVN